MNVLQGGEIGSGHSLMALIEIEPVQMETVRTFHEVPFAKMRMHYQLPVENINHLEEFDVAYQYVPFAELPNYYRFSASVALFGGLLKKSSYTAKTSWDELALIAKASYDSSDVSEAEYILLIEKAKKIYHKDKKKKKVPEDE